MPTDPFAACAAYRKVARAIAVIRETGDGGPGLDRLAEVVGMRPLTLQRTFSAWAGVSPKRFAQSLAAARATASLREGHDVLQSSLRAGFSGPGRLHDLLVTVEACSPGEVRSGGQGISFAWGVAATPFGEAFVASTVRGVHRIAFVDDAGALERERAALSELWPRAAFARDDEAARAAVARAFPSRGPARPLHLWVRGTNLQLAVWRALLRIPAGRTVSYGAIARHVRAPRAVRAVASAVAVNPVAWVIPCHRVLRSDGALAGYAWGLDRKAALLGWEGARSLPGRLEIHGCTLPLPRLQGSGQRKSSSVPSLPSSPEERSR